MIVGHELWGYLPGSPKPITWKSRPFGCGLSGSSGWHRNALRREIQSGRTRRNTKTSPVGYDDRLQIDVRPGADEIPFLDKGKQIR